MTKKIFPLPCPFCGDDPLYDATDKTVRCRGDHCAGRFWSSINAWNKRDLPIDHKEAFRQFQESLAALMKENELIMDRASHTEGIVSLVADLRNTNEYWSAGNIGKHQAAILNKLMSAIAYLKEGTNG